MMVYEVKMANERTPLITTVTVGTPRQRYPHQTLRRFCTIALVSSLITLLITFLFTTTYAPPHSQPCLRKHLSYEELQAILLDTPSPEKAAEWSRYYTAGPHLAGQNLSQVIQPPYLTDKQRQQREKEVNNPGDIGRMD
jgi:N-acetylated-alpha-linked acidic dipeptidase